MVKAFFTSLLENPCLILSRLTFDVLLFLPSNLVFSLSDRRRPGA